jgi:hypothetical protein
MSPDLCLYWHSAINEDLHLLRSNSMQKRPKVWLREKMRPFNGDWPGNLLSVLSKVALPSEIDESLRKPNKQAGMIAGAQHWTEPALSQKISSESGVFTLPFLRPPL